MQLTKRAFRTPFEKPFLCAKKRLLFVCVLWYTKRMRYDYKKLYEKNYQFYAARPLAIRVLKTANLALSILFFVVYAVALCLTASAINAKTAPYDVMMRILGAPLLCLLIVTVLRLGIHRPRPYSENGAAITPLLQKKGDDDKSFPSRHLACAFVISVSLLPFYTVISAILLPFAFALGYIRFALGLHYPTDLFGGAILGALCGLLVLV